MTLLLWRQTAVGRGGEVGWSLGELDLLEWMEERGLEPGDPRVREFFKEG